MSFKKIELAGAAEMREDYRYMYILKSLQHELCSTTRQRLKPWHCLERCRRMKSKVCEVIYQRQRASNLNKDK